jgi:hypothetical protein
MYTADILLLLDQMKKGIYTEIETAMILNDIIIKKSQKKSHDSKYCETCTILPWEDDGKLRIAAFRGHEIIDAKEAYRKYEFSVDLLGQTLEAAECCGSIECENILGNVSCGGDIECQNILGNARCAGNITCDKIGGNAVCNEDPFTYSDDFSADEQ